jgi:hypothetical protein
VRELNAKITDISKRRSTHIKTYVGVINDQRSIGIRISEQMLLRIAVSLEEIEKLKWFYREIWKTMGIYSDFPEEFTRSTHKEEIALFSVAIDREIKDTMCLFGVVSERDGILRKKIVDIGGEDDG